MLQLASARQFVYKVLGKAGSRGTIEPEGSWLVSYGGGLEFMIIPAPGHRTADVVVDGVSVGPVTTYAVGWVDGNHSISVSFRADAGP